MSFRPEVSRCKLNWSKFEKTAGGDWSLNLPPYYAGLFESTYPLLMQESKTGFRESSSGKTRFAFFPPLGENAENKINDFLAFYRQVVCLSTNRNIEDDFSDELDFCVALDFNKPAPEKDRTEIGEWEYQAKYQENKEAIAALADSLAKAVRSLPIRKIPRPRLLTYIPYDPAKEFYLPAELAKAIVDIVPAAFWGDDKPLVKATLTVPKKSAKSLTVAQKTTLWAKIAEADGIKLSRSVKDCSVIVVEDLYQSGASLWSFAKYLKEKGAGTVVGLACVKSLRDTDNQ